MKLKHILKSINLLTIKRSYKMSEMEIIKHDVLKLINKVEELEQMIINLTYKRKEEEK